MASDFDPDAPGRPWDKVEVGRVLHIWKYRWLVIQVAPGPKKEGRPNPTYYYKVKRGKVTMWIGPYWHGELMRCALKKFAAKAEEISRR